MNKNRYIKVPEGAIKAANELGILKDVEFYYQLKVLNEEGFFPKGSIVSSIKRKYKTGQSTIWRKIRRLLDIGLIRKDAEGYRICKYDTLFSILGYDMTYDISKQRRGNFKIFKLSLNQIDKMILHVAKEEIDLNLKRQVYKTWAKIKKNKGFKKLLRKECTQALSFNEIRALIERLFNKVNKVDYIKSINESKEAYQYAKMSEKHSMDDLNYVNLDITLTNRTISKLMGYKTSLKGFQIQKALVELKLIRSEKREFYLGTTTLTYKQFRKEFKDPTIRMVDSALYKRMPNKIKVL